MQVVGDDVGIRQSVRRILKMAHQQRVVAPLLDHVAADMAVRLVHRVEARRRMPLPNRVEQLSVQIPIECAGSAQEFSAERGQAVDVLVRVFAKGQQTLIDLGQSFCMPFAFDELTDLAADGRHHLDLLVVRRADLSTEKLDHAEDLVPQQNWEASRPTQPCLQRNGLPREIVVLVYVRDPGWLAAGPDPAR